MKESNKTFRELWDGSKGDWMSLSTEEERLICYQMKLSDRGYIDNGTEGDYLYDFLQAHGDKIISSILFKRGDPHCRGIGIIIIN